MKNHGIIIEWTHDRKELNKPYFCLTIHKEKWFEFGKNQFLLSKMTKLHFKIFAYIFFTNGWSEEILGESKNRDYEIVGFYDKNTTVSKKFLRFII